MPRAGDRRSVSSTAAARAGSRGEAWTDTRLKATRRLPARPRRASPPPRGPAPGLPAPGGALAEVLHGVCAAGDASRLWGLMRHDQWRRLVSSVDPVTSRTALHYTARSGDADMCELLIQHRADVHAPEGSGKTPLMMAAMSAQAQAVKTLLAFGAEPDHFVDDKGRNAFHFGCYSWNPSVPHLLMERSPSIVTSTDREGRNGLYYAATNPHQDRRLQILELALRSRCDPNHTDCYGWTPLWYASQAGSPEVVNMLVVYGADPSHCTLDSSRRSGEENHSRQRLQGRQDATNRLDVTMLPSPAADRGAEATALGSPLEADLARTAAQELAEARATAARYAARCEELEAKLREQAKPSPLT